MGNSFGSSQSPEDIIREALQELVNLSLEEKLEDAGKYFAAIWPELRRLDPEYDGKILLYYILGTAAGADGGLTEDEAAMVNAVMSAIDVEWDVEDTVKMMRNVANNDGYETVKNLVRAFNPDLTSDLISFIATICAIDDRVKASEQQFIIDLVEASAEQ